MSLDLDAQRAYVESVKKGYGFSAHGALWLYRFDHEYQAVAARTGEVLAFYPRPKYDFGLDWINELRRVFANDRTSQ